MEHSQRQVASEAVASGLPIASWAESLATDGGVEAVSGEVGGWSGQLRHGERFTLVRARLEAARALDAEALSARVAGGYELIRRMLSRTSARHAVRVWNHIPGILDPIGPGLNRYMAFNAGRFAAYEQCFGGSGSFDGHLPTASGVGHDGDALELICLACAVPGRAVDNPRQSRPHRYSLRYGPRPPCFARATRLPGSVTPSGADWLLVGGTASVRGEESVHPGDLSAQLEETLENLAAVVQEAGTQPRGDRGGTLSRYRHVRVYYPNESDRALIERTLRSAMMGITTFEPLRAELCRGDLLVEIEGVAEL